jgi:hypothetical protein
VVATLTIAILILQAENGPLASCATAAGGGEAQGY